jgi:hypothetical protein|tara:strand:+ start:5347 stop:5700 length:354 start_codon:yes stop_codon:yes gene_type:complete
MPVQVPDRYKNSKFVTTLAKKENSATKRAYNYKRQLDEKTSIMGQTIPVQVGAIGAGALSGMLAPEGDLFGLDASLVMGVAGVAIGAATGSAFLVSASQGSLAHWSYTLGRSFTSAS